MSCTDGLGKQISRQFCGESPWPSQFGDPGMSMPLKCHGIFSQYIFKSEFTHPLKWRSNLFWAQVWWVWWSFLKVENGAAISGPGEVCYVLLEHPQFKMVNAEERKRGRCGWSLGGWWYPWRMLIWLWINTFRYNLVRGWTSINPKFTSYFDVNRRATGFWPIANMSKRQN